MQTKQEIINLLDVFPPSVIEEIYRYAKTIKEQEDRVEKTKALFGIAKLPPEYDDPHYDPYYEKLCEKRLAT